MSIFLTSDNHFGHKNIIKYCNRPFDTVGKMTSVMMRNWNERVKNEDEVYVLGDFWWGINDPSKMKSILSKLKGTKHLILGNHDDMKVWTYINAGFQSVHTSLFLRPDVFLIHDPAAKCGIPDDIKVFHGHLHHGVYTCIPEKNVMDVGVDGHGFYPIDLEYGLTTLQP